MLLRAHDPPVLVEDEIGVKVEFRFRVKDTDENCA